ncbi:hypothetical protein [Cellulomonas aerilata]|uniref:Tyr recombinase domain-containing protein n=1 Tax=Cellulomonas aerilata TaxID=515326 RepID=A0A512DBU7_9CELL|nr:hypothetical protein [Cellulomonas aerilata]GEO33959.1 hypothetical protein CAE01nite_16840 [Cellulomonas aerilata]
MATYAEPGQHGRVFVRAKGATPYRSTFRPVWAQALVAAGVSGVHLHDLRHAGNHLAGLSGATTRELMGRMGHVSMLAALIYKHRTHDRDRRIADSMDLPLGDRVIGSLPRDRARGGHGRRVTEIGTRNPHALGAGGVGAFVVERVTRIELA